MSIIVHRKNKLSKAQRYVVGLLITALCTGSCNKFVQIPAPTTELVTSAVFSNDATASNAITEIYTQMFNNFESEYAAVNNGLLSDELTSYALNGSNFQYYINQMNPSSAYGTWPTNYNYIYQANAVLEGLQQYSGTSASVKKQLMGEAYFIRAFWFFYLSNCYGDLPLVTTTNYTVNAVLPRSPRLQVLQQVVSDLYNALSMLNSSYVDGIDTTASTDRVRPNTAVGAALLAKVYLYMGDYDNQNAADYTKADSAASTVINNSLYSLPALSNVFLANSSETIWQLQTPEPASVNTYDGQIFILLAAPGFFNVSIGRQLMSAFETGDQRRTSWIDSVSDGTNWYYFPYKYKVAEGGDPISEYTMVLRLAEQYLIRAESRVHENNIGGAQADLNMVRNRAGLPNTSANTAAGLMTAILHERQVELFTEWGNRWFDLNRTGNTTQVMSVVTPLKGGTWNSNGYQELYPIPLSDIKADPKLTQNPNY
jgi:hypothetical protein